MRIGLRENKGFWSGLMLIGTGAGALMIAKDYRLGSALRMGPGYFPSALGGILVLLGILVLALGLKSPEPMEGRWSLRALILLPLSLVLFGLLMQHAGFVPALLVLIVGSAAAGEEFNIIEALMLAAVITLGAVAVFIWGLGLAFPLIIGL
jgi:Tripartite tricarboxylate transporter TctB family